MQRPRVRLRAPGVKTGRRIGPLGPFRGRLGLGWVIASLVVAALLAVAGWYFFFRFGHPEPPFRKVARVEELRPGRPRRVDIGVFVGRTEDGRVFAVAEREDCPLRIRRPGYADCDGILYRIDGTPRFHGRRLPLVPVKAYRGEVYVDPTRRL